MTERQSERIISADSHLELKPEKILAHLPRQHHEAYQGALMADAPAHPRGQAAEAAEEQGGRGARRRPVGLPTEKPWEAAGRPGAYDPHERLKDMDIDQVDAEVLYASATGGAEFYAMDADACLAVVPGHQRRRDRVRVGRPEPPDPRVHPPAARHRERVEGGAAHRQRGRARGAAPALPVRRRARAVLGRRVRPAVVGHRGARHPDQPAHRRERVPVRAHGPRPDAGEGHLPVAAVDVHGRGDGELARCRASSCATRGCRSGSSRPASAGCRTSSPGSTGCPTVTGGSSSA